MLVGPVPLGTSKFMLTAPRPDASAIPEEDILGATVVLVTCAYRNHEFIRVVRDGERGVARRAKFSASPTLPPPPPPSPSVPPARYPFLAQGYWVNNTYGAELQEGEAPPSPVPPHNIIRSILADRPRVTRFPWPAEEAEQEMAGVEEENK